MAKFYLFLAGLIFFSATSLNSFSQNAQQRQKAKDLERSRQIDTRVDNQGYWKQLIERGLVKPNPMVKVGQAVYTGSEIKAFSVITEDSPDVPVTELNSVQSENSIAVNPLDDQNVLNSNNSGANPVGNFYGANDFYSFDGGTTWGGELYGAGEGNSGDPVALIGNNGFYYVGFIANDYGQAVAVSEDQGATWTPVQVAINTGQLLDKNHMWVDNCPTSPHEGNLYCAWTDFGGSFDSQIATSFSSNNGYTWSSAQEISSEVNSGSHNQGVNINTGPNGQVYAVWAIYDSWPSDESALGFARSLDGGATWDPATRIIQNIRGIRMTYTSKNQRVNAFPSMTVDISGGEYNGNIYVVWTNVGTPGINTGNDEDVYMIRSSDQGLTWSVPIKINQDQAGLGKEHYFPWIVCDPESGVLSAVFYDDRNVSSSQCEVYCANSYDAGATWEDFKVSDVAFTPSPIPGLADGYMGDYLGITARAGYVYPSWTDTRTGYAMTYVSPYLTNPLAKPKNLTASLNDTTGETILHWSFETSTGFTYFKIYRDNDSIGTSTDTIFVDMLPTYGIYSFKVTAFYTGQGESTPANTQIQWGNAHISVTPDQITETLLPDSSVIRYVTISNVGELQMDYDITMFVPSEPAPENRAYCTAIGGCDEYISRVQVGTIDNSSSCTGYANYTAFSTTMSVGNSYNITITNGVPNYPADYCQIWVDWNQDEVWSADEEVVVINSPGIGPYNATITPPIGSLAGPTRMRARITYYTPTEPCGVTSYGEAEDYTINVLSWLVVDPLSGSIQSGDSQQIAVTLDASGLALGIYTAELRIFSNDPDHPETVVPITLNVANLSVQISADKDTICVGESVQLTSTVLGSENVTYIWSSDPPGFTSTEQNVTVTPDTTTVYTVEITDGSITVHDSYRIVVNPLPEVNLGPDQSICQGNTAILDAGTQTSYLWSNGSTDQTISVTEAGAYWVTVTNEFGCVKSDTANVIVNALPVVSLGQDTLICYNYTIMLNAGNPGSTFMWSNGETTQSIVVDTTGMIQDEKKIWVDVINPSQCASSDTIIISFKECTGIDELANNLSFVVYPNPNEGLFTVKFNTPAEVKADLEIVNAAGKVMFNVPEMKIHQGMTYDLDLRNLSAGIYSLRVMVNGKIHQSKVIIQK
jgi:hypothetical protein